MTFSAGLMMHNDVMEDLHPELEAYKETHTVFGTCIRHPLVYSILHPPQMNHMVNRQFEQKKLALAKAWEAKNWQSYIWLHERPWRLEAFNNISDELDSPVYWSLLGNIWVDSENIYQNHDEWRDLLEDPERGYGEYFMDEEDRKVFTLSPAKGGLPNVFTVYRGFSEDGGEDGFSWTVVEQTAEFFAKRLCGSDGVPRVATGTIGKKDVIAYMTGRGEAEIVAMPENVFGIEIREL